MKFPTISEEFASYIRAQYPNGTHPEQFQQAKVAFYAGCVSMRGLFSRAGEYFVSEQSAAKAISGWQNELAEWHKQYKMNFGLDK